MPTSPRVAVIVMAAMAIVLRVDPVLIVEIVLPVLVDHVASVLLVTVPPVDRVQKVAPHHVAPVPIVLLATAQLVDHVLRVSVLSVQTVMLAVQSALPRAVFTVTR
jgi:hypothetical protein